MQRRKTTGTVFKKTFTKPLPVGAKSIVCNGRRLTDHIVVYLLKLAVEGTSAMHRDSVRRALHRLATG